MIRAMPLSGALAALLALGACGSEPMAPAKDDASPAPAPAAPATTAPPAAPVTADTIPARFQGVWDAETGTCDPASDLRLEIAGDGIGFYESRGTPTRIAEAADGIVSLTLAMEGEGETWDTAMSLEIVGAGAEERLIVQHAATDGAPAPDRLRLKRCPA